MKRLQELAALFRPLLTEEQKRELTNNFDQFQKSILDSSSALAVNVKNEQIQHITESYLNEIKKCLEIK